MRIDTPQEVQYYQHGGILHYVLRQLLKDCSPSPRPLGGGATKNPAPWRDSARGEERELKEIRSMASEAGSTPETRLML